VPQRQEPAPQPVDPAPLPPSDGSPSIQPETPTPEEGVAVEQPAATASPRIIEVEDNAAFPLEDVEAIWAQFVEDVRAENRLTFAQLEGAVPINIEEQTVVLLATKGKWQKSRLENEKTRRLLERMLSKMLNIQAHIRITVDEQEEMPDTRKRIQNARNDPMVRKAINIFEAEVIGIDTP
jgi:DNA polymerase-3 subunit gamma/tau